MESRGLDFESAFTVDKGFSDSESENERESLTQEEESDEQKTTKKASDKQTDYMLSFMDGRPDFSRGKMKLTEENKKLLADWETLTKELNHMGPAKHTGPEWRKIWTHVKANKKRRTPHQDNQPSVSFPSNPSQEEVVTRESEPSNIEKLLAEILTKIDKFEERQSLVNKDLSEKIDLVVVKVGIVTEIIKKEV